MARKHQNTPLPPPTLARRWWHEIPMPVFYIPIAVAVLFLGLRYRAPFAVLNANSRFRLGGLFPGSKQDFFELLQGDPGLVPASIKLEAGFNEANLRRAWDRFCELCGSKPNRFVVKPDDGVRGQDIRFFDNADELLWFWKSDLRGENDWLLQEYVGGIEVAIFYNKANPKDAGRVLSMTLKHGFEITGDGKSPISELIDQSAADPATRNRVARTNKTRLAAIPAADEAVELIPVRNHHLGATFQDITALITPRLEAKICGLLDTIAGFNHGRLDCRVSDLTSLQEGKNIRILEANALYSEPVHAYDPRYNLRDAYRIFISHWHHALLAGLAHRKDSSRH